MGDGQDADAGHLEGDVCGRGTCEGVIEDRVVSGCQCHINPPCGACTTPREHCRTCGWTADDEQAAKIAPAASPPLKTSDWWKPKPLDPTRISYRIINDSSCSQKCVGVYPLDPSKTDAQIRAEIEKQAIGSFGGRFLSFGGGRFEYRAYTD